MDTAKKPVSRAKILVPIAALLLAAVAIFAVARSDELSASDRAVFETYSSKVTGACQAFNSQKLTVHDPVKLDISRTQFTLATMNAKEDLRQKLGSSAPVAEKMLNDRLETLGCPIS